MKPPEYLAIVGAICMKSHPQLWSCSRVHRATELIPAARVFQALVLEDLELCVYPFPKSKLIALLF